MISLPFRRSGQSPNIDALYGMIVAQARSRAFYLDYGVPDTVPARLDMIVLHLVLLLRQLPSENGGPSPTGQRLFDRFCRDIDDNFREMGVGDLKVPKRMQAFGEAFYGRTAAYDLALTEGQEALAQALCKNILNGTELDKARRLAIYAVAAMAALGSLDEAALLRASWNFPAPAHSDGQT